MTTFTKVQVLQGVESDISSVFRPMIKFGIWCGLCGLKTDLQSHSIVAKFTHWIYVAFVQFIIVFAVLRYAFVLFSEGSESERFVAILSAQSFFCGFSYVSALTTYSLTTGYPALCKSLDRYNEKYGQMQKVEYVTKAIRYIVVLSIPVLVLGILALFLALYFMRHILTLYLQPFNTEILWQNVTVMIHLFFDIVYTGTHTTIIFALFTAIWFLFVKEFDYIDKQLKDVIGDEESIKSEDKIEKLRQQFVCLVDCFTLYNRLFKHCIFGTLSVLLPCVCFWLYGIIRTDQGTEEFGVLTLFMSLNATAVLTTIFLGAFLNSKAHQPLMTLNKIDLMVVSDKTSRSVSMFVSRLSGPPIGFTVYGLFTLDPPAILRIFGALTTYAVVMLQFADTAPNSSIGNANCSLNTSSIW